MSFIVPIPPNPSDSQFKGNQPLFNSRQMEWMSVLKGRLEQSKSLANGIAIQSPVAGDMAYYANNLGWARLAGGTVGQILTYGTGTAPAWGNVSSNLVSGTGISVTGTGTATINTSLAAGTNISINGTATQTIALSSNVTNSFPARTAVAGTAYTILNSDYLVAYTTLGTAVTATLPSAIGITNQKFLIKDEIGLAGTYSITVATSTSAQKIDGTSSKIINSNFGNLRTYSNGTNFFTW